MLILGDNHIENVFGGSSNTIFVSYNLKIKETTIETLPILFQLSEACVKNRWNVNTYTNELIKAGIDPSLISISSGVDFEVDLYGSSFFKN